jgi:hypothetical protein
MVPCQLGRKKEVWRSAASIPLVRSPYRHPPFQGEMRSLIESVVDAFPGLHDWTYEQWEHLLRMDTNPDREIRYWLVAARVPSVVVYPTHAQAQSERCPNRRAHASGMARTAVPRCRENCITARVSRSMAPLQEGVCWALTSHALFSWFYDVIGRSPGSVIPSQVAPQQSLRPFHRNFLRSGRQFAGWYEDRFGGFAV